VWQQEKRQQELCEVHLSEERGRRTPSPRGWQALCTTDQANYRDCPKPT